jgi:hypothetical protein
MAKLVIQEHDSEDEYCVFATVAGTERFIAKCSSVQPATHVIEFGPATRAECERYVRGG